MKNFCRFTFLGAILAVSVPFARADSLSLGSFSAGAGAPALDSEWGTLARSKSTWIGISPEPGYSQYSTIFNASGGIYNGNISLLADGDAEILINGVVVDPFAALTSSGCSGGLAACATITQFALSGITLNNGNNTLTFVVEQAGVADAQNRYGIDFYGSLDQAPEPAAAPEPNSLILLATGMLGATGFYLRRRSIA